MVNKICLFLFLLASSVSSQTIEPTQHLFNWNGEQKYLSADDPYFKQTSMLRGWQWGASKKILKSELSTQSHYGRFVNTNDLPDSINIIENPIGATHGVEAEIMNGRDFSLRSK